ncbi:hypothetical protein E1B28_003806 [Marasmius oreades]|uniref:F-box domain-containing protein n=1 Tax=Marasmius oreades TaxID=181124 RepID=A0A9P7UXA7_9AGAR|nr:uncharacterized protein E1B28_003806 [Marasmius oreades]KAG7096362.1 hypothetical protein E1B28_003806 [Marasmius oreades]
MDQSRRLLCDRCQSHVHNPLRLHPIDPILLHSIHVPSQVEIAQTLDSLEKETQQLQQYENTIDPLRRILKKLEAERQQLEVQITRRHSITSVQRRLPVEIWETIFSFACSFSSEDGYSLSIGFDPVFRVNTMAVFPILLSHVCSRWRAIAFGCHTIWSSISINRVRDISMNHKILVGAFLANSGKSPLNIRVVEDRLSGPTHAMWELLKSHLSRCERLSVALKDYTSLETFGGADITFHDLLSLRVDTSNIRRRPELDNPFWQALCHALKLTQARVPNTYPHNPLPYPQLTTLVLDAVHPDRMDHLLRALELSRNLCSFTFLRMYSYGGLPNSLDHVIRPVQMPSLRTLLLSPDTVLPTSHTATLEVLCSSLMMPNLSAFGMGCTGSTSNVTHWPSSLLAMLRRSSTTLRHMWLSLLPIHEPVWEAPLSVLLEITPNLTHLELGEWCKNTDIDYSDSDSDSDSDDEFDSLISSSITVITYVAQNTLLPNLEYISLVRVQLDSDILAKLLTFAASRSPCRLQSDVTPVPSRSLKKIRIVPPSVVEDSSKPVLEAHMLEEITLLEQDGVKVVIENSTEEASSWPLTNVEGWENLRK